MSELSTTSPLELSQPAETIAEAQEAMLHDGVGFVEGFLSREEVDQILAGLTESEFVSFGRTDFVPVQGRHYYMNGPKSTTPDLLWDVRDSILNSFDELSKSHPEFLEWSLRAGMDRRFKKQLTELVRYPEGVDVAKHIDLDDGEYPSQALLTVDGEGELLIYEDLETEEPSQRIPLKPGTLVFLRGNEVAGLKQKPHEVKHAGPRTLFTVSTRTEEDWESYKTGLRAAEGRRQRFQTSPKFSKSLKTFFRSLVGVDK